VPAERERHLVVAGRLHGGGDRERVAGQAQLQLEPVLEREDGQPVVAAAVVERRSQPCATAVGARVGHVPVLRRRERAVDRQLVLVGAHDSARAVDLDRSPGGDVAPVAQPVRPRVQQREPERPARAAPPVEAASLHEQLLAAMLQRGADHARARDEHGAQLAVGEGDGLELAVRDAVERWHPGSLRRWAPRAS
jgi:hypothetical protein